MYGAIRNSVALRTTSSESRSAWASPSRFVARHMRATNCIIIVYPNLYAGKKNWRIWPNVSPVAQGSPRRGRDWRQLRPDKQLHVVAVRARSRVCELSYHLGRKKRKAANEDGAMGVKTIFKTYSLGAHSNRDAVVYDFNCRRLVSSIREFIEDYNAEVDRYKRHGLPADVDGFVKYDRIKWSSALKDHLRRLTFAEVRPSINSGNPLVAPS